MDDLKALLFAVIFFTIITAACWWYDETRGVPSRVASFCGVQYEVYGISRDTCIESFKQRRAQQGAA